MTSRPLEGVRVIDFCWVGAGSYTTRILADLGADVIKIESSTRLDQIRMSAPFKDRTPGVNRSGYFADRNAAKRSVTVDLKEDEGRALALRLIADANVVANNFSPGTMTRLGLGYDDVVAVRPDVIFVEMSMQGASGPHHRQVGYGLTIGAVSGLQYLVGERGRPPTGTGTNYPDHVPSPGHAAFAIVAALRHWRATGEGQYVDLAQTEATIAALGAEVVAESFGVHQESQANASSGLVFEDAVRVAGDPGWIAFTAATPDQLHALGAAVGITPPLADVLLLTTDPELHERERQRLEACTVTRDGYDLMAALQAQGVPAGVVQTARELVGRDQQLEHRGHWARLPHVEMGDPLYNVLPFRFATFDITPSVGAPLLGEHTVEVLSAAGIGPDELARLTETEVLR